MPDVHGLQGFAGLSYAEEALSSGSDDQSTQEVWLYRSKRDWELAVSICKNWGIRHYLLFLPQYRLRRHANQDHRFASWGKDSGLLDPLPWMQIAYRLSPVTKRTHINRHSWLSKAVVIKVKLWSILCGIFKFLPLSAEYKHIFCIFAVTKRIWTCW